MSTQVLQGDQGPRALLAGGGSGGHVFPGLAVATELSRRGWNLAWAGAPASLEERLVTSRGVVFHGLPARPVAGRSLLGKVAAGAVLMRSGVAARALVRRLDARVVLATGGYASVPAALGGRLARRPVLLLEPNAEAGSANRWLSRFAAEAVVAYGVTQDQLRCPSTITGVPVRSGFLAVPKDLPEGPPRLLVLGGSQGAVQLNESLPEALAHCRDIGPVSVCHQAGANKEQATLEAYGRAGLSDREDVEIEVVPFLEDVAAAMARSHLVISRAGAITLAEICAAGRPSLLVPLTAAAGHQAGNARRLVEIGAARMLESGDLSPESLAALLRDLLGDRGQLMAMGQAARAASRGNAAAAIADRVEHWGGRG